MGSAGRLRRLTNANVEEAVAGVDGQTFTLKHKTGEKKIVVTPQTAVVTYNPGDRSELKPGTKIFIAAAKKQPDGTLQAARINYGKVRADAADVIALRAPSR